MYQRAPIFTAEVIDSFTQSLKDGQPLNDVLNELALYVEDKISSPLYASILLTDKTGKHLQRGAAPSLPEDYSSKIDGIEIGANVGSCGTAVFCGHSIFVVDIETDILWANYKDLALKHNLRACWSVPIFDSEKNILGTFALYYNAIKNPTLEETNFIEKCATTAGQLIEQSRVQAARL